MPSNRHLTSALRTFGDRAKTPFRFRRSDKPEKKVNTGRDFLSESAGPRAFISAVDDSVEGLASNQKKTGGFFSIGLGKGRKKERRVDGGPQKQDRTDSDSSGLAAGKVQPRGGPWDAVSHALKSPLRILSRFSSGAGKRPQPSLAATEDFLSELSMDEAIALLEAEMAEDLAPALYSNKERGLARFEPFRKASEKLNALLRRRIMTITVENEVVRIVVFQDNEVVAWGVANPKQDPFRGLEMARVDNEFTSRMKGLLNELQFRRLRVVADLPFYVPLMRHLQLPKLPKKYMDSVVVSEVLETVPFVDEEVDIPWQFKRNAEGNDIFAVAVPKKAVDEHVEILKSLNVHPHAAYSRSTGLAFAAGISNAIVVHLTQGQAAVILVHDGAAQTVSRVELDPAHLDDELQAEIVTQAIEQVEVYYQPDANTANEARLPILITGPLVDDNPLADAIAKGLPNEIMPFAPAITYPEHFVPHEYAVNIGLALSDMARSKPRKKLPTQRKPTVNLLSARHLPKPWPVWPAATFVTLLMLGVMAVSVTSQVNTVELEALTLDTRLQNLQRQVRQFRLEQGQATAMEQRLATTDQLQDELLDRLALLEQDKDYLLQRAYWMTTAALTPNIRVNNVSQQGGAFSVTGMAVSYEDVLAYAAQLRGSELFSGVTA